MRTQNVSAGMDPRAVRGIRVRVCLLALVFAPLMAALLWRAVNLQVVEGQKLSGMARDQYLRQATLPGRRGAIYDRRGAALAASVDVDSIFADPAELPDLHRAARELGVALKLDAGRLAASFETSKHFAWVKRQAPPQEVGAVKGLGLPGLGFVREPRRFYPQRELAAHVLGFAGVDGEGLEGVELALDGLLKGKPQQVEGLRDARGRQMIIGTAVPAEAFEGAAVTLTLDRAVQYLTEKSLAEAMTKANAAAGAAVVLDPSTGEILALASVPTFNPNDPARYQKQALRNRALADQFEPGSTFKVFTIAGALEEKAVRPTDTFFCENGRYAIGKHAIHDHGGYGLIDVARILQVSSNIGAAKIAEKLGRERLASYQRAFGFGEKPGTGLLGEAKGSLPFPKAAVALATQAFGQGISASAVQIAAAFGAIANGGTLMRPYLVARVVDPDGEVVLQRNPEKVRQAVSRSTAQELLRMMRLVVQKEGTAPLAHIDEWEVAGKTGTAQKAENGVYSVHKRTASFVGIVPAEAPRLVILVVIDEPQGDVYGGLVAAPAFKEIAKGALAHLGVSPSPGAAAKIAPAVRPTVEAPSSHSKLSGAFAMAQVQLEPPRRGTAQGAAFGRSIGLEPGAASEGYIEGGDGEPEDGAIVPDVQGLTARAAVKALAEKNLEPALLGSGKAIGQSPPAGTSVRKGTRVSVRLEMSL
jgi:cell division protein FtsI (penicillin-binding protein 3)